MFAQISDFATNLMSKVGCFLGEGEDVQGDAKARKSSNLLVEVDYELLKKIVPYQYEENFIFHNKQSFGFGFELSPCSGANESLVNGLAEMLKTKLPKGVAAQFILYKHGFVGDQLKHGLAPFVEKGGVYKRLAEKSAEFHVDAIKNGYKCSDNLSASLCDYKVYAFYSCKKTNDSLLMLKDLRTSIIAEFDSLGLSKIALDKKSFATFIKAYVTPDIENIFWPEVDEEIYDPTESIVNHCFVEEASLEFSDNYMDVEVPDRNGSINKHVYVNCSINKYPKMFALWQTPDLFANIYDISKSISCSFAVSFVIHGQNQDKARAIAKSKAFSLAKSNNGIQNFINSYHQDELSNWTDVSDGLAKEEIALYSTCYNLILFSDENNKAKHVSEAVACYRKHGFELRPARCMQSLTYLASLPFVASEGIWRGLEIQGATKPLTSFNIANLLPIVSDFKGSPQGILLPTYRNQISFNDSFDAENLPLDNNNYTVAGTSGSGKSFFEQEQVVCGLAQGEQVFVIDIGDSYKHLCTILGGVYVDASNVVLNPFSLFDFEGSVEIEGEKVKNSVQIRNLLAIMASPNEKLERIQMDYLLDAVQRTWEKNKSKSSIDDVVNILKIMSENEYLNDTRITDLITHLKKYTLTGIYGHMFNGETPNFRENKFVVFELGAIQEDEDLLQIVLFVMIVIIQGQFYQTPRSIKKRCVIEEGWRWTDNSNETTSKFINQGFRTARKHNGGFGFVTQDVKDLTTPLGQAIKGSSSTDYILYQKNLGAYITKYPDEFNEQQQTLMRSFGEAAKKGYSSVMIQYGESYTFNRLFADPFKRILYSTTGSEFEAVETLLKQGVSIEDAATQIAEKCFGVQGI